MGGIESVSEVLECLAAGAALAVVEPDGQQCQQGKGLQGEENFPAHEMEGEGEATDQHPVDIPHTHQLYQPAPALFTGEVEEKYSEDAVAIVVHKGDITQGIAEEGEECHEDGFYHQRGALI